MSNLELLAQVGQLSRDEKFQMVQFLMTELAKEEELKPLENSAAYRLWSPYDPADAARKLMSLLEKEVPENVEP
jgi:ADP-ribose pyrophosphatase YjhB (NUDIX family)